MLPLQKGVHSSTGEWSQDTGRVIALRHAPAMTRGYHRRLSDEGLVMSPDD